MAVDVSRIPNNNKFDPVREAILQLQAQLQEEGQIAYNGILTLSEGTGVSITGGNTFTANQSSNTTIAIGVNLSVTQNPASGTGTLSYLDGVFTYTPPDLSPYLTSSDVADFITLTDLSVTTVAASGNGALSYDNTTGVFTFTPSESGAGLTLQDVTANGNTTTFGISTGNITVQPAGTGSGVVSISANSVGDARVDLTAGTGGDGVIRTIGGTAISFQPNSLDKVVIASGGNVNIYEKLAVGKTTQASTYAVEVEGTVLAQAFKTQMVVGLLTYTGDVNQYFNSLQIRTEAGGTIELGGSGPSSVQNDVTIPDGNLTVSGNVTATSFIGDGSQLTGITVTETDTLDSVTDRGATTPNVITTGGAIINGVITLPQNPVGTTYGNGISTVPSYMIQQGAGDNDGIRLYAEAGVTNDVRFIFEVIDDIETGDTWVFRNKKTYGDFIANEVVKISGVGDITANSFIKSGGTSSQFLKADGSVDSNTYLTSYTETDTLQSVTDRGATTTQTINAEGGVVAGTGGVAAWGELIIDTSLDAGWGATNSLPYIGSSGGTTGSLVMIHNPHVPFRTDNAATPSYDGRAGLRLARNTAGDWWDIGLAGDFFHIYRSGSGEFLRITSAGKMGIGVTSPDQTLHVHKGSAGTVGSNGNTIITAENSVNGYIQILVPDANESGVLFGSPVAGVDGAIVFNNTTNLRGLQFRTSNNQTRFSILANGNVIANHSMSIGKTTSPTETLDVNGNVLASIYKTGVGAVGNYFNSLQLRTVAGGNIELGGDGPSSVQNNVIIPNGSLGIGTTSPASILQINKASSANTVQGGANIIFSNRDSTSGTFIGGGIFNNPFRDISESSITSGIWFENKNSVGAGALAKISDIVFGNGSYSSGWNTPSEKMRLTNEGYLGIGTTTPTLSPANNGGLEVRNNTYIQQRVSSSTSSAGIEFIPHNTGSAHNYEIQASSAGDWFVYDRTAESYRFVINSSGNVGIATTTPSHKLHVNGDIRQTKIVIRDDSIERYDNPVDDGGLNFNYLGYNSTTTYFRDVNVWNGKGGLIAKFDGSSGNVGIANSNPAALFTIGIGDSIEMMVNSNQPRIDLRQNSVYTGQFKTNNGVVTLQNNSDNSLQLGTNATPRITILGGGNVGIGTTTPSNKLEVNGGITATSFNTGNGQLYQNGFWGTTIQSGSGSYSDFAVLNSATNGIMFNPTGTLNMVFNGNVGIGTTTPSAKLHVEGSSVIANNTTIDPDSYTNKVIAGAIADGSGWALASAIGGNRGAGSSWAVGVATNNNLYMGLGNGASDNTMQTFLQVGGNRHVFLVPTSGNVGIGLDGTTSPIVKFDVRGTAIITNQSGTNYNENLRLPQAPTGWAALTLGGAIAASGSDANQWSLLRNPSNFFEIRREHTIYATINTSGNVGIGTTTPRNKLQVEGNIEFGNWATAGSRYIGYSRLDTGAFGTDGASGIEIESGNFGGAGNYDQKVHIWTHTYDGGSGRRLTVDNYGRVGIGTTTPQGRLDVYGGRLVIDNSLSNQSAIQFNHAGTEMAVLYRAGGEADKLRMFITGAGDVMSWTNAGRVGIGTTTPSHKLDVQGNQLLNGSLYLINTNTRISSDASGEVGINYAVGNTSTYSLSIYNSTSRAIGLGRTGDAYFAGNVGIGTTSPSQKLHVVGGINVDIPAYQDMGTVTMPTYAFGWTVNNTGFSGTSAFRWEYNGTLVGRIAINSTSTTYATTSDYRVKENLVEITDGIERLKQLKPKRFNFIGHEEVVDGFVAHEAQEVVPECVIGEKDAVDAKGNPELQGIDQAKLVPLLTAALQEAVAKIEALEQRILTLESK